MKVRHALNQACVLVVTCSEVFRTLVAGYNHGEMILCAIRYPAACAEHTVLQAHRDTAGTQCSFSTVRILLPCYYIRSDVIHCPSCVLIQYSPLVGDV